MANPLRTVEMKQAYLEETDADEKNVGSVAPRELDAMGIRNDAGRVSGDSTTPFDAIEGLDEEEVEDAEDELNDDTEVNNLGIGLPGSRQPMASELIEDAVSVDELDDEIGDGANVLVEDAPGDVDDEDALEEEMDAEDAADLEDEDSELEDDADTDVDGLEGDEDDEVMSDESSGSTANKGGR